MKIYAVLHHYDNGLSYEDYRYYTDTYLFETHKTASDYFWTKVTDNYEGKYELYEWELDTQNKVFIEDSIWITCTPIDLYDDDNYDLYQEPEDYFTVEQETIEDYLYTTPDAIDEATVELEWLTHEGENYKLFKEMEETKLNAELKSLNSLLDEQLAYAQ